VAIADLTGRTAVVTGAGTAGGLGGTIAEVLAAQGAAVAVADLDVAGATEVASSLPKGSFPVELDVGSPTSVEAAFEVVRARFGHVDIVVNNAGIGGAAPGSGESDWEATFRVNVLGTVRCTEAALPAMRERRYGKIVNIGSISGHSMRGTAGAYGSSKAAVLRYTKGLAVEVAPHSINVNAVCPAAVWTGMQSVPFATPEAVDPKLEGLDSYEAFLEYYRPLVPLGRPQSAADVAKAVAFLASDDASNITGQCLHVDGGAIRE
jgi:NAD(P)-dependent dehydrogenase (short-subunit alcohol dehydrogenase family)